MDALNGVRTLADVDPEHVEWLWPGRLPAGKMVIIDGDPSVGKSTLTIDIAARLSAGVEWPDGAASSGPGDVLLLSAEDGLSDTIVPRLIAAGADRNRVHALVEVRIALEDEDRTIAVPPSLPRDIAFIETTINNYGVKLVVIDVLFAYLGGKVDAHRDQDVRGVLHQLAAMAERTGACVVMLRHLNKIGGGNPLYRGGGSIGIVGAARAAYIVGRDPDDNERRVIAASKMNIAREPSALAYRLVDCPELGCARVEWEGVSEHTAATLLAVPATDDARTELDEAVDWLRDFLSTGAADRKDVLKASKAEGISQATLLRAQSRLRVKSERSGFPATARWTLPVVSAAPGHKFGETTGRRETTGRDQGVSNDHLAPVLQLSQLSQPERVRNYWDEPEF